MTTSTNRYPCFDLEVVHAPAQGDTIPSGKPVRGGPWTGNVEEDSADERAAFLRARYPLGCFVRRDDGCVVLLQSYETPSVCGYINGHGTRVSSLDGHLDGQCATGPLEKCSIVRLGHKPMPRPTVNW